MKRRLKLIVIVDYKELLKRNKVESETEYHLSEKEHESRDFIIGNETSELMAKSALNVLLAVRESQKYGEKEGHFTTS